MLYVWPQSSKTRTSFVLCKMLYLCCETSRRKESLEMNTEEQNFYFDLQIEWLEQFKEWVECQ